MAKASDYIPALKYGHKIFPEDIAGVLGLPTVGTIFYVDPSAGNDTANSGVSSDNALKTVAAAFAKCTSGKHDVVVIAPTGGTGRTAEGAAIVWNKRFTHLIGSAAPTHSTPRAGMAWSTTDAVCLTVSENGCVFKNISIQANGAANLGCVLVTGSYNYFEGVHFLGQNHATSAANVTSYSLSLSAAEENLFIGCTLGGITVARTDANCNLQVRSNASMNRFVDCDFNVQATNAGVLWVDANTATAIQAFCDFVGCRFLNYTLTAMTIGMNTAASGGYIRMLNSHWYGATNLADFNAAVLTNGVAATASDAGVLLEQAN